MQEGRNCRIGEHAVIADDVRLGNDVVLGNNVTIYPNAIIEDGCRVMDGAVIGRLTHSTATVSRPAPSTHQPLLIGAGGVIGCHVVLYTGVRLGREVLLADGASVREDCVLEDGVLLGRHVTLNYNSSVGKRSRIMDGTHITGNTRVGEDCFISVLVATTNDNDFYLRRFDLHDREEEVVGPSIGNYVAIGSGVSVNPGIRIGDGALIASGSVVTRKVSAWMRVLGVPARPLRPVSEAWQKKIRELARRRGQTLELSET